VSGARIGTWGNCVINTWQGVPDPQQIAKIENAIRVTHTAYPSGVSLLVLIESGAPMPTADQRKELENFYVRCAPQFRCVAQVVEGTGMWAVMGRSVMAALRLVQRRPYPNKVFSDLNEALAWLEPHVENPGANVQDPHAGLKATVDSLRGPKPRVAL
jgi:hypothetical protein